MDIVRLIVSILFPPVGLLINFIAGAESKLQKAAMYISNGLCIALLVGVIGLVVLVGGSNGYEENLQRCINPYKCDPSDGEYQTCYYCKDKVCKNLGKVQCVNDTESRFNYSTETKENDDIE